MVRFALLILLVSAAGAQQTGAPEVRAGSQPYRLAPLLIRAQTNSVDVNVVVRNRKGLPESGLTRDNFRVLDDGQARPLASFDVESAREAVPAPSDHAGKTPAAARPVAPVTAPPRFIALYFDDVNTGEKDLGHARIAAARFVREALGAKDAVAVLTGSGMQEQNFTTDRTRLLAAIAAIHAHPRATRGANSGCLRITPFQAYLIVNHLDPSALAAAMANEAQCERQAGLFSNSTTSVYVSPIPAGTAGSQMVTDTADAVWQQSRDASLDTLHTIERAVDLLGNKPGERILLLASGGFLGGTLEGTQGAIIQRALREQVTINALDARGLYTEGPGDPLDETNELVQVPQVMYEFQESSRMSEQLEEEAPMANLAQSTGGLLFRNNNDLTLGFYRLGLTPEITYALSFAPAALPHDGKFHKLKVELVPPIKGAIVQARRGYFDPAPASPAADLQQALDAAMRGNAAASDVPARISVSQNAQGLGVDIRFNVARLPFLSQHGRRRQLLILIAGLFNPNGRFVTGEKGTLNLALTSNRYKHFRAHGLGATLRLSAPPGPYRLRVAVGEATDGKISSSTRAVVIR